MQKSQKKTETCSKEQLKKLNAVKRSEWKEAQKALLPIIARQLHGRVKTDKDGHVEMVGGYTKYGVHSESEVGGEALFHYWGMIVQTLYDGTCTWAPELSLEDQLKEMAEPVIDEAVKDYRSRRKEEERLGLKGDDRDRLLKRLRRKVQKKSYPMGNRRGRKKRLKNSVGFWRNLDNRLVKEVLNYEH